MSDNIHLNHAAVRTHGANKAAAWETTALGGLY
jgi:hypothetical protein